MDNGQLITNSERNEMEEEKSSVSRYSSSDQRKCSACGANSRRETAKYCLVCGKLLKEDYQPLDTLRASYRLQGQAFLIENAPREDVSDLFKKNENTAAQMAWACFVYSLVPYLGILFVPLTFVIAGGGYFVYLRCPRLGGRKFALVSFFLSFVVLGVQILLWWLLYIIPKLGRQL